MQLLPRLRGQCLCNSLCFTAPAGETAVRGCSVCQGAWRDHPRAGAGRHLRSNRCVQASNTAVSIFPLYAVGMLRSLGHKQLIGDQFVRFFHMQVL